MLNTKDIVLVTLPFVVTGLFIVVGYNLLIANTPEAAIAPPEVNDSVEILLDGQIEKVAPPEWNKSAADLLIVTLPQNQSQLADILIQAENKKLQGLYVTVPLRLKDDDSVELADEHKSSRENLIRWARTTISDAHRNNLLVSVALTLNASKTIADAEMFMASYLPILEEWSGLAREYGAEIFVTGLTLGHPVYSDLSPVQLEKFLNASQKIARDKFGPESGGGICCRQESPIKASNLGIMLVIPTPEFSEQSLANFEEQIRKTNQLEYRLLYNRETQTVQVRAE